MCARLTLPHAEQRFSDVMSLRPLPAMNRCRFLRYDVFFLGTAFKIPSQISPSDGNDGNDSEGIASAANGVGSMRNGCDSRCRSGRLTTGRIGPLRAGISVCHSGGSGRASAMVAIQGGVLSAVVVMENKMHARIPVGALRALPNGPLARRFVAAPFRARSCDSTRKSQRP